MTHAIATLAIALENAEHNEPICRAEGRIEEADAWLAKISDYKQALKRLGYQTAPKDNKNIPYTAAWSTAYLAKVAGLNRMTILRELKLGRLQGSRMGSKGNWRIADEEARRFLAQLGINSMP